MTVLWLPWRKPRESREEDRQPLLAKSQQPKPKTTPLPWKNLTVLCFMRCTEPLSFTLIFPFINQMLEDLQVTPDRTRIGYYAGIIESLFALSQLCTVFLWGRLSDRIGRKPVLLTGLAGLTIGITAFGLQKTFVGLVVCRCFAGLMNGNIAILKSVLAEITDDTNQARAFALLPMCYAIGSILGPSIGGYLAKPADQYPSVFGHIPFFREYPYFLPCAIGGSLNLFATVTGFLLLEETLPTKQPWVFKKLAGTAESAAEQQGPSVPADPPPSFRSLMTPQVASMLVSFGLWAANNSAWAALVPLYSYTRLSDGGLGLSFNQIGTALAINGIFAVIVQVIVFPPLQRRFGTIPLYRVVAGFNIIAFVCLPILNVIRHRLHLSGAGTVGGLIIVLAIKAISGMGLVCITMLVSNSAPTRSALGTVNGLSQSCSSLARGVTPVATTSLFALSIDRHVLGGQLIWFFMVFLAGSAWCVAFVVKEPHPAWRETVTTAHEEQRTQTWTRDSEQPGARDASELRGEQIAEREEEEFGREGNRLRQDEQ